MKYTKEHSIGKVTAILLALVLLLPVSVKLAHTFENHKHEVCTSKDAKHYHEIDHDCEFHKFKTNSPLTLLEFDFEFVKSVETSTIISKVYYFLYNHQQLSFSLRAPPELIS